MKAVLLAKVEERIERNATYAVLLLIIFGELAGLALPDIEKVMQQRGEILLIALALLLVFRLVVRQMENVSVAISPKDFREAVIRTTESVVSSQDSLHILANDGAKYFHALSDSNLRCGRLEVLVADEGQKEKWQRLVERHLVGEVEVRRLSSPPPVHFMFAKKGCAMVGRFSWNTAGQPFAADKIIYIDTQAPNGRAAADELSELFGDLWQRSA